MDRLDRIGRFEIQAEIGRGGFGQIFRAFDPEVGRVVAIKVLRSVHDPGSIARFRSEATAAGNLHHRNIITIYEFGEHDDLLYIVMEYLEGEDLQRVLAKQTSITLLQKMDIMSQVAAGLHYAHSHGVLNRDVKPSNIMVLPDGSVKIMDFGIARITREDESRLTQTGSMIGTLMYMAPELFTGLEVDVLCEIWTYGVVYYELLSGKKPFAEGGNSPGKIMFEIVHHDPSVLPLDVCPEALQSVLKRLLAREREMRYQSLEDVLFDTQPILIELRRKQAEALLPQAQSDSESGDWNKALQTIRSILELDPQNAAARMFRERAQTELRRRQAESLLLPAQSYSECGDLNKVLQAEQIHAAAPEPEEFTRLVQSQPHQRSDSVEVTLSPSAVPPPDAPSEDIWNQTLASVPSPRSSDVGVFTRVFGNCPVFRTPPVSAQLGILHNRARRECSPRPRLRRILPPRN